MSHVAHKPHGACHWLVERATSIALVPLVIWLVYSVVTLRGASYADFTAWLSAPLHASLLATLIVIGFWHGVLGTQVIIEDYVGAGWFRTLKLALTKIFFTMLAVICLLAIHKIAF